MEAGYGSVRSKVFVIIKAVIRKSEKVIAVCPMHADELVGRDGAVGAGGVAVQAALEQPFGSGKRRLTTKHENFLLFRCEWWTMPVYHKSARLSQIFCCDRRN